MDVFTASVSSARKLGKRGALAATSAAKQQLLSELQDIESRAHALGLHVTAQALNRAKNAMGWETAGNIDMAAKVGRGER